MFFSRMKTPQLHRITVSRFGGLDLRDRPAENSIAAMENLCSDGEGALRSRPQRSVVTRLARPGGVTDKETLIWVDGQTLYVGGTAVGAELAAGEKQFVSMGAYLLVIPDKLWVNLRDLSRFGSMENTVTTQNEVQISLCRSDGTAWEDYLAAETPPAAPEEEPLWLDLSGKEPVLRQYSEGVWTAAADVCTMLRWPASAWALPPVTVWSSSAVRRQPSTACTCCVWYRTTPSCWALPPPVTACRRLP